MEKFMLVILIAIFALSFGCSTSNDLLRTFIVEEMPEMPEDDPIDPKAVDYRHWRYCAALCYGSNKVRYASPEAESEHVTCRCKNGKEFSVALTREADETGP